MAKKHNYVHTHVIHHDDGSHTIHIEHKDGKSHKDFAVGDHDSMIDGIMDHTSEPNEGEDQDESGKNYAGHEALEEKLAPGLHAKMAEMGQPEGK